MMTFLKWTAVGAVGFVVGGFVRDAQFSQALEAKIPNGATVVGALASGVTVAALHKLVVKG